MFRIYIFAIILFSSLTAAGQQKLHGYISSNGKAVPGASIIIGNEGTLADSSGMFEIIAHGTRGKLKISALGFIQKTVEYSFPSDTLHIQLEGSKILLDDIVITGTMKAVNRMESPVPVEVYTPVFLKKNPTPNIFDALQNVNGVRPQLNCNVCNTGDIHINGLEGPYTMVLIDGMPLVSSLSTVYGLSGIPSSLVERIEIVKGPASSLYGSEAVGGLINIITKNPATAPVLSIDIMNTSWNELNADIGFKTNAGKFTGLTGINYYRYNDPKDKNGDNFTDVTLQHRISVFQKWNITRTHNRIFNIAARYFYEDRWGGELQWDKKYRGGDEVYGESIYTNRWEVIGNYQLPTTEKMMLSFSMNDHQQNSRYGTTSYIASQQVGFAQLTWDRKTGNHDLLAGGALRITRYDDNTAVTSSATQDVWLPGLFLQDEISISAKHKILLGFRYDHNSDHGNIYTPRLGYKWTINGNNIVRLNAGSGFRVVNVFTEDHAALTGAREVIVNEQLDPERSVNINLNYLKKINIGKAFFVFDISTWLTRFNNRIIADLDADPNKIIYNNLSGYAVSRGLTFNTDATFANGIKFNGGITLQDVFTVNNGIKQSPLLTEKFMGTWALTYKIKLLHLSIDYTGNIYGPMRLPLLGASDPRKSMSPMWSIQNIQFTRHLKKFEVYAGVKNLLNWTPVKNNPFLIARSHDPFDKNVEYDMNGQVIATAENPYALTFDPNYLYAPNQGLRFFMGMRFILK